jgi:Ca2+-binding RTX toxin-like protein
LLGSGFADQLIGTDGPNFLFGSAGNDGLDGEGGDDTLIGSLGLDNADGGPHVFGDSCDAETETECEV